VRRYRDNNTNNKDRTKMKVGLEITEGEKEGGGTTTTTTSQRNSYPPLCPRPLPLPPKSRGQAGTPVHRSNANHNSLEISRDDQGKRPLPTPPNKCLDPPTPPTPPPMFFPPISLLSPRAESVRQRNLRRGSAIEEPSDQASSPESTKPTETIVQPKIGAEFGALLEYFERLVGSEGERLAEERRKTRENKERARLEQKRREKERKASEGKHSRNQSIDKEPNEAERKGKEEKRVPSAETDEDVRMLKMEVNGQEKSLEKIAKEEQREEQISEKVNHEATLPNV